MRRQSEHFADYVAARERLAAMGLVYPSFLSRAEIAAAAGAPAWPRDPDGAPLYPGDRPRPRSGRGGARIAAGAPHAFRLRMDAAAARAGAAGMDRDRGGAGRGDRTVAADPRAWGDFVLARKETPTSYHLSVVVDDAAQGVTHVVRGQDLFHATAAHVLLQRLLGLPTPAYHHHRLVTDAAGRKLAKSDRDTSLRSLREAGTTPAEIRAMMGVDAAMG